MLLNFDDANPKQKICEADPELLATPIYRIYQIRHIVELFLNHRNSLFRPSIWDDPFENPLWNTPLILDDEEQAQLRVTANYFGQCWSLNQETDAMWRIYSHNKYGIKACTTIGKLYESLKKKTIDEGEVFIGKVKYETQKKMKIELQDIVDNMSFDESDWALSFLLKRKEFRHEKEIRLLYVPHYPSEEDRFVYGFNPLTVFEQVMFDPRLDDGMALMFQKIFNELGFESVKKSELYDFKPLINSPHRIKK